ncbi:MAG: hypothetical protein HY226_05235 [Candidatus Vogelbacteria bacterium]|nr:hypothetical protein [Candidatus Vogelbacteria bacterium]
MSYASMARDAVRCDFPDCYKEFDDRPGKKVARIKKDGWCGRDEVIAFCTEHCARLTAEGVVLRTLRVVHDEMSEAEEGPIRRRMEAERVAREKKFIEDLKK